MDSFNPNKPYTVVSGDESTMGGFDPAKPFSVVSILDPPKPPESLLSGMVRGGVEAAKQIPQLAWGVLAGGAAVGEAAAGEGGLWSGVKKYAVDKYVADENEMAKDARPEDSFNYSYEKAKEGDLGALMSWGAHGIGYVGGQALTMLTGVGVGEKAAEIALKTSAKRVLAGMVEKEASRIAEESLLKEGLSVTADAVAERAASDAVVNTAAGSVAKTLGQHATAAAYGYGMEGGEIGGDLAKESVGQNRSLTGEEVFKGISSTFMAGTVEYAETLLGIKAMRGKLPMVQSVEEMAGTKGRLARGGMGLLETAPLEAGQEYVQTGMEQWGKGQDMSTPASSVERSDAAWLGALGGSMGFAGGVLTGPKNSAPAVKTPPATIATAEPDLTKEHTVDDVLAEHQANVAAESAAAHDLINNSGPVKDPNMAADTVGGILGQPDVASAPGVAPPASGDASRLDFYVKSMAKSLYPEPSADGGKAELPSWIKLKTLKDWEKETGEDVKSFVSSKSAKETLTAVISGAPLNNKQSKVWGYLKSVAENMAMKDEQAALDDMLGPIDPSVTTSESAATTPADHGTGELSADFGGPTQQEANKPNPIGSNPNDVPIHRGKSLSHIMAEHGMPVAREISNANRNGESISINEAKKRVAAIEEVEPGTSLATNAEDAKIEAEDERFTDMVKVLNSQTSIENLQAAHKDMAGIFKVRPELAPYADKFNNAFDVAAEKLTSRAVETSGAGQVQTTAPASDIPNVERHEVINNPDSVAHGHEVNTAPSEAQSEAGNYKKAHVKVDGLHVTIENPAGSTRAGTDKTGRAWSTTMAHDYGYLKGTIGYDKDHVDVFMAPGYQGGEDKVFVVNQHGKDGKFDEHKAVLGAKSSADAMAIYNANYEKGWTGGKSVTEMSMDEFKSWAKSDAPKKGPVVGNELTTNRVVSHETAKSEPQTTVSEHALNIVSHVTKQGKGKTIKGIVRTDITKDQAKAIDPYTFRKDGGFFIREKYLTDSQNQKGDSENSQPPDMSAEGQGDSTKNTEPRDTNAEANVGNIPGRKDNSDEPGGKGSPTSGSNQPEQNKEDDREAGGNGQDPSISNSGPVVAPDKFAGNKIFTADAMAAARARLAAKRNTLAAGFDPELVHDMLILGGGYFEAGIREFAEWSKTVLADIGEEFKPFLRGTYENLRHYPGIDTKGISSQQEIDDHLAGQGASMGLTDEKIELRSGENKDTLGEKGDRANDTDKQTDKIPGNDGELSQESQPAGDTKTERGREVSGISPGHRRPVRGSGTNDHSSNEEKTDGQDLHGDNPGDKSSKVDSAGNDDEGSDRLPGEPVNYRITDADSLGKGGAKTKAKDNIKAIQTLKALQETGRPATQAQQAALVKYVGWGASELANGMFPKRQWDRATGKYIEIYKEGWESLGTKLKGLLSEKEYAEAMGSTLNAHYTSQEVIGAMYRALERFGFDGKGRILEPGSGIGNFIGLLPDSLSKARFTGVEMDPTTAGIAKLLYPGHDIRNQDFAAFRAPNDFYDVAIGNPPFLDVKVTNDPDYVKNKFLVHDFFFAKSIDKVRPGGIMMLVTSKGTMDKADDKARAYLSQRADLIGAVRLPQTAFKENAGTEVVTDVIFLKKRKEGEQYAGEKWNDLAEAKTPGGESVYVNEYFVGHPEMVLGDHSLKGSMYGPNQYTVEAKKGAIGDLFDAAVNSLPEKIYEQDIRKTPTDEETVEKFSPTEVKEGGFYIDGDKILQKENGVGIDTRASGVKKRLLIDFIAVRDAVRNLLYLQLKDKNQDLTAAWAQLNKAYDGFVSRHGFINKAKNTTRTLKDGSESTSTQYLNFKFFKSDPDAYLVASIEKYDSESKKGTKADIFSQRVIDPAVEPKVETLVDALHVSLHNTGEVNIGMIADAMNVTEEEAVAGLEGILFKDPTGNKWVTNDDYLSGNVRAKLQAAKDAAAIDKSFEKNVKALEEVQPEDLPQSRIQINLGMPLLDPEHVQNFAQETMSMGLQVSYLPQDGSWKVNPISGYQTAVATSDFGTNRMHAGQLIEDALNGSSPKVFDLDENRKPVLNKDATQAAIEKVDKIKAAFRDWLWTDSARAEVMGRRFNDLYNNTVKRVFGGDFIEKMQFPGMSLVKKPFEHQKRVAWRILQRGNTYMAHSVGAGKTIASIISGMEMKRLGIKKKPAWTVPNHMLKQFAGEFLELYPAAKILVADEEQFAKENRNRFMGRVAAENWDAIIITHSAFRMIPMSADFQGQFIDEQIRELDSLLQEVQGDRLKRKQIERLKKRLQSRLEKIMSNAGQDKGVEFEQTGIDHLFVDEAHEFRKLDFATNQSDIKGIDPNGSAKAFDLFVKSRYLETLYPSRSLVLMSGTAVTNTLGEIYSIQRYLQEGKLKELGLQHFDSWAATFGGMVSNIESTPAGTYKAVNRFGKLSNLTALCAMWGEIGDFVQAKDLPYLVRPKVEGGGRQLVIGETSDLQRAYKKELGDRIQEIEARKRPPRKGDDIILSVITDGRHAAMDDRYIDRNAPERKDSKMNLMLDKSFEIWKRTKKQKSTQMIFADLGMPGSVEKRGFSVYSHIKQELIARGVPAGEIAFMQDYKKSDQKIKLFKAVNEGEVRFLIGSSQAMGTGVNAQKKLVALHHFDPDTYLPANIEQREGRIVRQGNENQKVELYAYVARGSYDETMWQFLETKQRFIDDFLAGNVSSDTATDIDGAADSFAQARAMSSDNPLAIELAGVQNELSRLQSLANAHRNDQNSLKSKMDWAERGIAAAKNNVSQLEDAISRKVSTKGTDFKATIDGKTFTDRKEAGTRLVSFLGNKLKDAKTRLYEETIGKVGGFDLKASKFDPTGMTPMMEIFLKDPGSDVSTSKLRFTGEEISGLSPAGLTMRLENGLKDLDSRLITEKARVIAEAKAVSDAEERIGKKFEHQSALDEKMKRESEIIAELDAQDKAAKQAWQDSNQDQGETEQQSTSIINNETGRAYILEDLVREIYKAGQTLAEFTKILMEKLGKAFEKVKEKATALYHAMNAHLDTITSGAQAGNVRIADEPVPDKKDAKLPGISAKKETPSSPMSLASLEEQAKQMGSIKFLKNKKIDSTFLDRIFSTPEYYFKKFAAAGRVLQAALLRRDIRFSKEQEILGGFVTYIQKLRNDNKAAYTEANDHLVHTDQAAEGFRIKATDNGEWKVIAPRWGLDLKEGEKLTPENSLVGTFQDEQEAIKAMIQAEGDALGKKGYSFEAITAVRQARELTNRGFDVMAQDMRAIIQEAKENGMPDPFVGDGKLDEAGRYGVYAAGKSKPIALFASEKEASAFLDQAAQMISYMVSSQKKGTRDFMNELKAKRWAAMHSGTVRGVKTFQNLSVKKRSNADMRPLTVKQALAQMGDLRGIFFPRIRNSGEYVLIAKKDGENPIRKHFDIPTVGDDKPSLQKFLEMATPIGREAKALKLRGFEVTISKDQSPADDVFAATNLVTSLDAMLQSSLSAIDANNEADVRAGQHINQILTMQIADIFKSRGYLSSRLKRLAGDVVWEGYEEDMGKALTQYGKNVAAGTAKRDTARAMVLAFSGRDYSWNDYKQEVDKPNFAEYQEIVEKRRIDERSQKNLFRDVRAFMIDILRNDEQADRIIGTMKGLAVLKYLGFRVSSAAINMTNMVQGVPATIAGHTGEGIHTALGRVISAATAYAKYRSGKGELSAEDRAIFQEISNRGWDEAQFNHEAASELRGKLGESWNKFMTASMFMFGATEKANRAMTLFAAYKAVEQKNPDMGPDAIWEKAKEISDRAHGEYGKETLPAWARGKYNPLRLTYTFQKFNHNYMLNMLDLGFNKKEYQAAAYMLLSPALLAGAGSSLAGPVLFAMAHAIGVGGDDPEERWYQYCEELFGGGTFARQGLFGMLGVNLKGSLQMKMPTPGDIGKAKLTDLAGPVGGIGSDIAKSVQHFTKGELFKGVEFLLPTAFGSVSKSIREATEGVTTSNYGSVFYGDEPLKATTTDALIRFLSFNPARISAAREQQWNEKQVAARYQEEKTGIYSEIKRLHIQGKNITPEIMKEIMDYNDRVVGSGRSDIKPIRPSGIREMLRRNDKASKFEKSRAVNH